MAVGEGHAVHSYDIWLSVLQSYRSACHLDCEVKVRESVWVGGRKMGIEGVKAPVLGCNAPSLETFDFAGQLERMWSPLAQKPPDPLSLYLPMSSFHFASRSDSACAEDVRKGSLSIWDSVGVDTREM